jgi:endonuclease/exonuclease/phosphatase family metal-dependent hydrolase
MRLRLASYNIQKAVGVDLRRDPDRVIRVINALGADVIALQEADRRLGKRPAALPQWLIAQETDFRVADVAETDVSLGWHGNAILVRRGLDVRETERIPLPGLEPRGAVRAVVGDGRATISVVGCHLGLLRRWRRRQARRLADHLDLAESPGIAILGDFNEWSSGAGLEPLHHFRMVIPGRSFHAARPVAALDRVALGPGLRALDAGVDTSALARTASDHLPVWVEAERIPAGGAR